MGISPEDYVKMKQRLEKTNRVTPVAPAPQRVPEPVAAALRAYVPVFLADMEGYECREFTVKVHPLGKPRMTRRDQFIKRPIVEEYWAYKAVLREHAGPLPTNPDMVLAIAWLPMPKSWTEKKQKALDGQPCRQKPDWDNIAKGICDSLFDDDSGIWVGSTIKYWCYQGQERLNVRILYAKP